MAESGLPDCAGGIEVQQFQGGQSNPTFALTAGSKRYVLRKKPPGKLLPSAHLIEREYRIMAALADTDVPVPTMRHLCEDPSVIGISFFVMDYMEGRIVDDTSLPGDFTPAERAMIYDSMNAAMAALHQVDFNAVGLGDYGKPENYIGRQIDRWTRQFEAAKTDPMPAMDELMAWLPAHRPAVDEVSIAHGDFRNGEPHAGIQASPGSSPCWIGSFRPSATRSPISPITSCPIVCRNDGTSLNGLVGARSRRGRHSGAGRLCRGLCQADRAWVDRRDQLLSRFFLFSPRLDLPGRLRPRPARQRKLRECGRSRRESPSTGQYRLGDCPVHVAAKAAWFQTGFRACKNRAHCVSMPLPSSPPSIGEGRSKGPAQMGPAQRLFDRKARQGWVREWLNRPVLKTGRRESVSWVRIPPHPPALHQGDPAGRGNASSRYLTVWYGNQD